MIVDKWRHQSGIAYCLIFLESIDLQPPTTTSATTWVGSIFWQPKLGHFSSNQHEIQLVSEIWYEVDSLSFSIGGIVLWWGVSKCICTYLSFYILMFHMLDIVYIKCCFCSWIRILDSQAESHIHFEKKTFSPQKTEIPTISPRLNLCRNSMFLRRKHWSYRITTCFWMPWNLIATCSPGMEVGAWGFQWKFLGEVWA